MGRTIGVAMIVETNVFTFRLAVGSTLDQGR
jgi:hypothetical protein